ncbi:NinB protein [Rhizobium subbaraonis]|uniref:NinB protein n=1 Tax=Rhizobium subbaraonis TaxID=908946 RepID=A0A285UZP4_9HYPH|nr:recombination protein NinB [Rhizobium subbaraonis]SOC45721.1 NinB protein [Rhizobium subbaraonis]
MTTRASVTINSDQDRATVARWAHQTSVGTVVTFRKKSRSTEQSAKMWAMLSEVADQVEWYGQKLEADDWKDIFTASLRHARVVPGIDKGTFVPLGMRTSTMTIEEMSNLIELIYAFGAQPEHPVVFKEPQASDQSNSGEASPPSTGDDADLPRTASEGGESSSSSPSSSSPVEWLTTCARMLWAATHSTGNTDDNLDLLNNQRKAVPVPENATQEERDRAGSMYRRCKQVVLHEIDPANAMKMVAGYAGCDVREIGGE